MMRNQYAASSLHRDGARRPGRLGEVAASLAILATVLALTAAVFLDLKGLGNGLASQTASASTPSARLASVTYREPARDGSLLRLEQAVESVRRFADQQATELEGGLEQLPAGTGSPLYYLETAQGEDTFKVNARTGEVLEASWTSRLLSVGPADQRAEQPLEAVEASARSFASVRFHGFDELRLIERSMNPAAGGAAIYTLKWAAVHPESGAELPTSVAVSISSQTGEVVWYLAQRDELRIDARPQISRQQAIAAAAGLAERAGRWDASRVESLRLQVIYDADGRQQLVWSMLFPSRPDGAAGNHPYLRIAIDATTGTVVPLAS